MTETTWDYNTSDVCTIMLRMPILGRRMLTPTARRSTAVCTEFDRVEAADISFADFLVDAMAMILDELDGPKRDALEAWAATIPSHIPEQIAAAMVDTVAGHRCKDGPPHYRFRLMHVENREWQVERGMTSEHDCMVWMLGPGPRADELWPFFDDLTRATRAGWIT